MYRILISFFIYLLATTCFADGMPPTPVRSIIVKPQSWQTELQTTGTIHAEHGITVKPDVAGRVSKVYFKPGAWIEKDQPLIELGASGLRAELSLNKANLNRARIDYERKKNLLSKGATTQAEVDDANAQLKVSEAQVEQAKAKLSSTHITAPFSGRLGLSQVDVGDFINAGEPIVNLQATKTVYFDFSLPEIYLSQLKRGQQVKLTSDAYHKEFTGTVIAFDSKLNQHSQSLTVRAEVQNDKEELIPGAFVTGKLLVGTPKVVMMVPQTALQYSSEGTYVYKVVKGKAIQTAVSVAKLTHGAAIISDGLENGDSVVTHGQMKLFNGANVVPAHKKA